ncbi:MAG: VCBS repeat-containing protein [Cyclobacteriaceae bacterium]
MKARAFFNSFPTLFLICFNLLSPAVLHSQTFQKISLGSTTKIENNFGCAVADYDLDGDLDIFIVASDSYQPSKPETWSRLLNNNGFGRYEDVTADAGFRVQYSSDEFNDKKRGVSWGDYDNDGYPDLFLTHFSNTQLYHNERDGSFKDVSEESGITSCTSCFNNGSLWWDYDNDGDLDIYINDYLEPNRLFRNNGGGTFDEVGTSLKINDKGATWYSIPIDANQDGWMDLYVLNDFGHSRYYVNNEGKSFRESVKSYGLFNTGEAMGATIGDYNGDGFFDIYVTNISEFRPNRLYTGTSSGIFENLAGSYGVEVGHWAWGTCFFDADHDGDEDLYIVNGFQSLSYKNKFYKNLNVEGVDYFKDWSEQSLTDGDAHGMSAEVFDFDEDGDLDILVANTNSSPYLYQNNTASSNSSWIQIELEGTQVNKNAFGSVIKVGAGDRSYQRFYHGSGIMSQSIKPTHLGLGNALIIDSLCIQWPGGNLECIYNVMTNQKIKIKEQEGMIVGLQDAMTVTDIKKNNDFEQDLELVGVYPNPFSERTTLNFKVTSLGSLNFVVCGVDGRKVYQLEKKVNKTGEHTVSWNGIGQNKERKKSGIYYYTISFEGTILTGKLLLK